jgi:hypothetical protein
MIKLIEYVQPVFVLWNIRRPYLVDPTDAHPAAIFPILNCIYIKEIRVVLTDDQKDVIVTREMYVSDAWISEDESLRYVTVQ